MRRLALACAVIAAAASLGACATQSGPYAYQPYEAGMVARVEQGVIVGARPVTFGPRQQGSGAAIGGLGGAAVGSQFGGDTGGRLLGAVVGGLLGAAAGDAIEDRNVGQGFAYTIRRERDGSIVEIAQAEPYPLAVGQRVNITYGDRVRVVPAY